MRPLHPTSIAFAAASAVAASLLAVSLLVVSLLLASCNVTPLDDGYATPNPKITCTSCHGEGDNPAPPRSLSGSTSTSDIAVGAHRLHLVDSPIRAAIGCGECHKVPKHVEDPGHIDPLPAHVVFGPLARGDVGGGAKNASDANSKTVDATWDRVSMTCATYCHGATLKGGSITRPKWTLVDGSQPKCDSCHGFPPPAPHPPSTHCSLCHDETVDASGAILLANAKHINGVVDVKTDACNNCHGGPKEGGPPPDIYGNTDTSAPGVGAHRAHFDDTKHKRVACSTCHDVPKHIEDPGHTDNVDERGSVRFAGLAVHDALNGALSKPSYDKASLGCSNTYCHSGGAAPGANGANGARTPRWNVVDGRDARCNACHGFPPVNPHPQRTDCSTCHGNVVNADLTFVAPELHVDGQVETASLPCDACHGGDGQPAPPRDTDGNTSTSAFGVGAHRSHLAASTWHAPVTCDECHVVPTSVDAPGHQDVVRGDEVTFGSLASARGASPVLIGGATSSVGCSNIACHAGAPADMFDTNATNKTPRWTIVDGTQAACGTCHGLPPSAPHPARSDCASCHGDVIDAAGNFVNAGAKHINGVVDVSCNACHGDNASPAPPRDLAGNVTTTSRGVGAHRSHLGPSSWHRVVQCSECHVVPANVDDPGHLDGDGGDVASGDRHAAIHFGSLATSNGTTAKFDQLHCSVYCHGGGPTLSASGGSNNSPLWTEVDGTQEQCGACHGIPPPAPHPASSPVSCDGCHPYEGLRPIDPTTHVNGVVEVTP